MKMLENSPMGKRKATELLFSELRDDYGTIRMAIRNNADVNAKNPAGITPLMLAVWGSARSESLDIAKLLLGAGADPNLKDREGETALMYATEMRSFDAMELLLEKGADVCLKNKNGNGVSEYVMDNVAFWHQREFFELLKKHKKFARRQKNRQREQEKIQHEVLIGKEAVADIIFQLDRD